MSNPVTIQHDERTIERLFGVTERPGHVNYAIRGMHWDTVEHPDYRLSVQQTDFLGNHMQLIEMDAQSEASINFSIDAPTVFIVIMIEGFVKFHSQGVLVSYAMAGVLYMTYNPRTDFRLMASPGKHTMMVVSLDREWTMTVKRPFPKLARLADCLREEKNEIVVLPMCRLAQPMADLWESMRIVRADPFTHRAELAVTAAQLVSLYHGLLEKENCVKGQLSADIANRMFMYIEANYSSDSGISVNQIVHDLGIARHKVEEYASFLFGKSLHKHIRNLRMAKAAQLLRLTTLSVPDIALRVGYTNLPHFYEIFQQYFGVSPIKYRRKETGTEQD